MHARWNRRELIKGGAAIVSLGALGGAALTAIATSAGPATDAGAATTAKKTTTTAKRTTTTVKKTTTTKKPKPSPIATLKIARIRLNKSVYDGVDDHTLLYGPGRAMWGVKPGENGHCLLMGHRTVHGAPFAKLNSLRVGDPVVLGSTTYRVVKWEVLPASNPKAIWEYAGSGKRLSLIACSKPNGAPTSLNYRICVRCQA